MSLCDLHSLQGGLLWISCGSGYTDTVIRDCWAEGRSGLSRRSVCLAGGGCGCSLNRCSGRETGVQSVWVSYGCWNRTINWEPKNNKCVLSPSGGQKPEIKAWARPPSLWSLQGRSFLPLPASADSWQSLAYLGSDGVTPVSAFAFCLYMCLSLCFVFL